MVAPQFIRSMSLKRLKLLSTFVPSISLVVALLFLYCYSCFNESFFGVLFSALCLIGALILGIIFLTSFLIYLILHDLESIFTKSIYDGLPAKPSLHSVLYQLSDFLFDYGEILKRVLPWAFPSVKKHNVKHNMTGRIFTYISLSTLVYWFFVILIPTAFLKELSNELYKGLVILFLFLITVIFFVVKERVFEHYSFKLVLSERERLRKEKKVLIERFYKGLDAFARGTVANISVLSKENKLLEKRIAQINRQIGRTGVVFSFHRSLKLTIVVSFILVAGSFWVQM